MLYEVVCGRRPFEGSVEYVIVQVFQQEPPAPRTLRPETPIELEAIILKTLQKEPAKRYPDCAAMAADLTRFLGGLPTAAYPALGGGGDRPGLLRRIFGAIGGWFSGNGGPKPDGPAPAEEGEGKTAKKKRKTGKAKTKKRD
jgi:hypothetical protein